MVGVFTNAALCVLLAVNLAELAATVPRGLAVRTTRW